MQFFRPSTMIVIGWTVVLLLIAAFVSVLLNDRWQNPLAQPLMFWTLFSGVVLVAIACAIGLPNEKAAFWRTWVLVLCALSAHSKFVGVYYIDLLDFPLPEAFDDWLAELRDQDDWAYYVLSATAYASVATLVGTLAVVLRRGRAAAGQRLFRFRIVHWLLLSTVVAVSCWAITNAEAWQTESYGSLAVLVARVIAAVMLGAGRGHAVFLVGFLAGSYGLIPLVDQGDVVNEWCNLFGEVVGFFRPGWYQVTLELILLYAGLLTGVLAAMLYRPPAQPTAQEAQRFDT